MLSSKKILCLGNNTEDTNKQSEIIAKQRSIEYKGLLTTADHLDIGCYQTSIYDISFNDLMEIINQIDELIILDQNKTTYQDDYTYFKTINLANQLKSSKKVTFINKEMSTSIIDTLKTNKSFCIHPFTTSVTLNNKYLLCCRSTKALSVFDPTLSYEHDENRNIVKNKMSKGELLPEYCQICYNLENKGVVSPRISETVEWADRLNLKTIESIRLLKSPVHYEIRSSNKCNLLCRMCSPVYSSMIEKENKKTLIFPHNDFVYNNFDHIQIDQLQRLYVAGGEPTISDEFYQFLDKCVQQKKTNIDIIINTNCVSLSEKFKLMIKKFKNIQFEISVDGYKEINYYVRWPTMWNKLIKNIDYLYNNNFVISFNIVVSIYTIICLDKTIEFLSDRYTLANLHMSNADFKDDILAPYNFPDSKLILFNLNKIKNTSVYKNDAVLKSKINDYINWFSTSRDIDQDRLMKFFEFNDKLDKVRNIKLIDYIPELEACRSYLTKH